MIEVTGGKLDDYSISSKIRQILWHWVVTNWKRLFY